MNQKPCPTRTVERHGARNEVDLEGLRTHVLAVAQETMRPTHVSLWLCQPAKQKRRPAASIAAPLVLNESQTRAEGAQL
jgi:hypothetical protein